MTLMLHAGATPLDYAELRGLQTPDPTPTHVPIPHHRLVDVVRLTLGFYGHTVEEEHHGVTPDGMRYFGVLSLKSTYGDYTDTVGLRNSHDKTFPIGLSFGSRVFVCDNLAFIADHVVRRKHTAQAKRDLPGLVGDLIEPLADQRDAQHRTIARYRTTNLSQAAVDHAVLELYRAEVITVTRIGSVMERWEDPPHDWGVKTAWRLFNCVTHALEGRIAEQPALTSRLHQVLNATCAGSSVAGSANEEIVAA
ncbi:DUF932 domain-containing protein [Maritimibacter sp. 55A14]|uniref:DUF932 domain-containing protein n=1 Tax=Maritimibacter sp. 55A14 TaxID=2174844 RepID=UPI0018EEAF14|nr:DUF932 domain-containing protein [Maritimibacter sp. 55A14]